MPIDRSKYPPNWKAVSFWVRFGRAAGRCECTGQCGHHGPNPTPRRCTETNGAAAIFARGRVVLTVAHLCQCRPLCAIAHHLIATCQKCHLRIDRKQHAATRRATLQAKKKNRLTPQAPRDTINTTAQTARAPLD